MGEAKQPLLEPSFNRAVKVFASDDRITSDAGFILLREADHRLGLTESLAASLEDPRQPSNTRYQLVELLRERLYGLSLGYAAQDDADRLAHDPAMKIAAWNRPGDQAIDERLASQPTQSRLIDILTRTPGNRAALRDVLAESCERHLRATAWATAFCMRSCGRGKFTRHMAYGGSCKRSSARPSGWGRWSISASTPATPTAKRWMISPTRACVLSAA